MMLAYFNAVVLFSLFICNYADAAQQYAYQQYSSPPQQLRTRYDEDNANAIKDLRGSFEDLRHTVDNHETEIRTYDEKLANLDSIIESIRDQLNDANKAQKELLKGSSATLDTKISALENISKGLVNDLRQFKTHANDSAAALTQYKQKIGELEKIIDQQNQNIDHLQTAMRALMDALQVKETPSKASIDTSTAEGSGNNYRIKPGDSLEKIAKANNTTVQAIKNLNGLANDKIVVGKILILPEK